MMRPLESILEPDPRFANIGRLDEAGRFQPCKIDDMYLQVQPLELGPEVPEQIRRQFDVARSAFLYSWFEYELTTLAEHHSYSVLEMALRVRIEQETPNVRVRGLRGLFDIAVERGWLQREDYEMPWFAPGRTISLLDMATRVRNNLSHGKIHLLPGGSLRMMTLCAHVIVKLFSAS